MYRIFTERKNANAVKALLGRLGLDYTVYDCDGSWNGQTEKSMLIELDGVSADVAERAAHLIKQTNLQEAVLLQEIPARSKLI